jgi:hypothetical protein
MNYVLEGQENFNDRLLSALCDETNANQDEKICLISNTILEKNAITLKCNHHFNYDPLLKEVMKQKVPSRLEIQRLKKFQMKCPYCRHVHNHILPHRSIDKQIVGVNWPPKYAFQPHKCIAVLKSGKRKGGACNHPCFEKFCKKHKYYNSNAVVSNDVCTAILKSGVNKGKRCSYRSKKDGRCGLHKL